MTLDEQKLAVCEKLPKLVCLWEQKYWRGGEVTSTDKMMSWKNTHDLDVINWPTEGLQVCHEAEKLLNEEENEAYDDILLFVVCGSPSSTYSIYTAAKMARKATYGQRLEALCRVWYPERFSKI